MSGSCLLRAKVSALRQANVFGNVLLTRSAPSVRGPCPMLNSLANHGYIPRDGKGINKQMAIEVLSSVLNWDVSVVSQLYDFAQPTNPAPNATTIDLNHLTTHNILEHDGSLR